MTDPIEQILRAADDASAVSPSSSQLADRVWSELLMRRNRRRVAMSSATFALLAIAVGYFLHQPAPTRIQISSSQPHAELITTARSIDDPSAVLDRLLISDRLARAQEKLAQLRLPVAEENPTDRAAYTIVFQADRLAAAQSDKRPAEKYYRTVIQLFPDSAAAQVAQQRLSTIEKGLQS
jgi:hypothetical protein